MTSGLGSGKYVGRTNEKKNAFTVFFNLSAKLAGSENGSIALGTNDGSHGALISRGSTASVYVIHGIRSRCGTRQTHLVKIIPSTTATSNFSCSSCSKTSPLSTVKCWHHRCELQQPASVYSPDTGSIPGLKCMGRYGRVP